MAFLIGETQICLTLWRASKLLTDLCPAWVVLDVGGVVDREASRISIVGTILGAGGVIGKAVEVEFLTRIGVMDINVAAVEIIDRVLNGPLYTRLVRKLCHQIQVPG